jgi:hypothetical protein
VILQLLPAQHVVSPGSLRYDLNLTGRGCVAVIVQDAGTSVEHVGAPRASAEVDFRVDGDLAGVARLLTAGPIRRRFGWSVAKIPFGRPASVALRELARAPLGLIELDAAGVRLDAAAALRLVSLMIDPHWTAGERFTIGHESGVGHRERSYLQVRDGRRPLTSSEPPLGPVATTIVCPPEVLITVLAARERGVAAAVRGAIRPLALIQQWIARAQQGEAGDRADASV